MAKITEFIRLGLTVPLLSQTRSEAMKNGVSVNQFIRVAIEKYLSELSRQRISEKYRGN